jgi:hypothetical protein
MKTLLVRNHFNICSSLKLVFIDEPILTLEQNPWFIAPHDFSKHFVHVKGPKLWPSNQHSHGASGIIQCVIV